MWRKRLNKINTLKWRTFCVYLIKKRVRKISARSPRAAVNPAASCYLLG
jgi:hypothetical protein